MDIGVFQLKVSHFLWFIYLFILHRLDKISKCLFTGHWTIFRVPVKGGLEQNTWYPGIHVRTILPTSMNVCSGISHVFLRPSVLTFFFTFLILTFSDRLLRVNVVPCRVDQIDTLLVDDIHDIHANNNYHDDRCYFFWWRRQFHKPTWINIIVGV